MGNSNVVGGDADDRAAGRSTVTRALRLVSCS